MKTYIIVTFGSLEGLEEEEVNEKIDKGYIPIGIIGMKIYGTNQLDKMFYQPMILRRR